MQKDNHVKTALAHKKSRAILYCIIVAIFIVALISFNIGKSVKDSTNCTEVNKLKTTDLTINGNKLITEVSLDDIDQERGLSGRKCLAKDTGMLFAYSKSDNRCFWMKDMLFEIDIIWLNKDKKIEHIEHSVSPKSYPKEVFCHKNTNYVLELEAGYSMAESLQPGIVVDFVL